MAKSKYRNTSIQFYSSEINFMQNEENKGSKEDSTLFILHKNT